MKGSSHLESSSLPQNLGSLFLSLSDSPSALSLTNMHSNVTIATSVARELKQIIRNLIAAGWFVGQQKVSQCQNFDAFLQPARARIKIFTR
jgi:hypothetical protein